MFTTIKTANECGLFLEDVMKTFFAIALTAGVLGLGAGVANASVVAPGHPGGGNPGGGNPNGGGPNPGAMTHDNGDPVYRSSCPFVWKINPQGHYFKKCRKVQ